MSVYDHRLTKKAYLSAIAVPKISRSFTYKMAAKINWHYVTVILCRPILTAEAEVKLSILVCLGSKYDAAHAALGRRLHISIDSQFAAPAENHLHVAAAYWLSTDGTDRRTPYRYVDARR